jgi:hypothetical protein
MMCLQWIELRVMGGIYGERALACKRVELSHRAGGAMPTILDIAGFADHLKLMGIWRRVVGSKSRTYFDLGWSRMLLCELTPNNAIAA